MESYGQQHNSSTPFKVMVVDDALVIRQLFRRIAELTDVKLYEAENGQKALELTDKICCDLYFIDLRMQGLNGCDTALKIHQKKPNAKIYIITAYGEDRLIEEINRHNFELLHKPFNLTEIINRILAVRNSKQ
ncbi:MAG: response regulator [Candidatus Omnitrophica bacterium]|nr:response regulator [Candidatus Omnitrophota bacterium]